MRLLLIIGKLFQIVCSVSLLSKHYKSVDGRQSVDIDLPICLIFFFLEFEIVLVFA